MTKLSEQLRRAADALDEYERQCEGRAHAISSLKVYLDGMAVSRWHRPRSGPKFELQTACGPTPERALLNFHHRRENNDDR